MKQVWVRYARAAYTGGISAEVSIWYTDLTDLARQLRDRRNRGYVRHA